MMQLFKLLAVILFFLNNGVFGDVSDEVSVSVMEGDSVTLIYVETNKQEDIKWYFNDTQIAEVTGNHSKIYTDNQDKERFGNRLQVNQTGSLTITNITNTDSGEYKLQINSSSENIFNVTVNDVPAAELHGIKRKSVKEGESVTLDPEIVKNPNDTMKWYFNEILIAEITGDQSEICSDVQCNERFRDRLKLDHQTGSLTIMNITNTDFGVYKLQINSSRFSIFRSFTFLVASPPSTAGAGTNATGIGGVVIGGVIGGVVILLIAAVVIYYCRKRCSKPKQEGQDNPRKENGEAQRFLPEQNYIEMNDVSGTTTD